MKIKNYTQISIELLREMIRFACPSGVTGFDITFKNSYSWRGRAFTEGTSYHDRKRTPYVVVGVPKDLILTYSRPRITDIGKGYLKSSQYSWQEDLVHLIAHELRHLWQNKVPKGWRVWGARGKYSERDADAYAIRMTRHWRRRGSPHYGPDGAKA